MGVNIDKHKINCPTFGEKMFGDKR